MQATCGRSPPHVRRCAHCTEVALVVVHKRFRSVLAVAMSSVLPPSRWYTRLSSIRNFEHAHCHIVHTTCYIPSCTSLYVLFICCAANRKQWCRRQQCCARQHWHAQSRQARHIRRHLACHAAGTSQATDSWSKARAAFQAGTPHEGRVRGVNKGGILIDCWGVAGAL
jgi:hypothetical protein